MRSKDSALLIAKMIGCSSVHRDESGEWMPCSSPSELRRISSNAEDKKNFDIKKTDLSKRLTSSKRRSKRKIRGASFEMLRQRGIAGIATGPDGSLSSMPPGSPGALY